MRNKLLSVKTSTPLRFQWKTMCLVLAIFPLVFLSRTDPILAQRRSNAAALVSSGSLTISTEPNAIVWIDDIRRGVTDASGRLELNKSSVGRHILRVRATGFREATMPLLANRRSVAVKLVRTTNKAELACKQAEDARDRTRHD